MADADLSPEIRLEQQKLEFERYKAQLDFRKFVLGSVFVAIAIALIPPLFQLATAALEYVKSQAQSKNDQANKEAEQLLKKEQFRDQYVKDFLNNAINQDIELRIRFAEYFAFVADTEFKQGWIDYREALRGHRLEIRKQIDQMESDWQQVAQGKNQVEMDRLARNLKWAYNEVGYVEGNRSVASDPRAPVSQSQSALSDVNAPRASTPKFVFTVNKDAFYASIKEKFISNLTVSQMQGIHAILDYWQTKYQGSDSRMLAYILATAYQETAGTMHPIEEYGRGGGRPYGSPDPSNGNVYYGRGILQLTWAQNYRLMGQIIGVDLYGNPQLALELNNSVAILIEGLMRGVFAGRKLADFVGDDRADWINARRIVTGQLDHAAVVAAFASSFFDALQAGS
ncbi:MAG: glycoside hydrolase family 19 protein [Hyphomicrobiales bacterium]